jgi:hypothetical protein
MTTLLAGDSAANAFGLAPPRSSAARRWRAYENARAPKLDRNARPGTALRSPLRRWPARRSRSTVHRTRTTPEPKTARRNLPDAKARSPRSDHLRVFGRAETRHPGRTGAATPVGARPRECPRRELGLLRRRRGRRSSAARTSVHTARGVPATCGDFPLPRFALDRSTRCDSLFESSIGGAR